MIPPLYAIADRTTLDRHGLSMLAFAAQLRDAGCRLLQVRDKSSPPQDILRSCRDIDALFAGTGATLLLNDRADLAALLGWGVHLGQDDLPLAAARKLLGPDANLGVSTHTDAQVLAAAAAKPTYIAIGPVFATSTKPDAAPAIGLEGVRRARALTTLPLVAIGGLTSANCHAVLAAGADSVATISALVPASDSDESVHALWSSMHMQKHLVQEP